VALKKLFFFFFKKKKKKKENVPTDKSNAMGGKLEGMESKFVKGW
jgi:hypothetical protein